MSGNRISGERIDRELGAWLREETETRAPAGLAEDVFARTSRMRQASRWWPPSREIVAGLVARRAGRHAPFGPGVLGSRRTSTRLRLPALIGAVAVLLVAVVLAIGPGRRITGPGGTPSPTASSSPTGAPGSSGGPSSTVAPSASAGPVPTTLGTSSAQRLDLGPDAGPIDVIAAFDSIWVANIHANEVRRYDPVSMAEIARIPVDSAAWLAVTGDAVWVTSQTGQGVSRIDPATNRVVAHVGEATPCAAPVLAFGSLWQTACDSGVLLRIDPVTSKLVDTIPLDGHRLLVLVDGELVTVGPEGLARLDPQTRRFATIGGGRAASEAEALFSDGSTIWVLNGAGVARLDPTDGHATASFPYPSGRGVAFAGDHAWLTVANDGVVEVDLGTNAVRRTIPLRPSPLMPLEAYGALWVTDFDGSRVWRIEP